MGGLLIMSGGYTLLFATLTGLALAVAGWAALAIPTVPALPRARQTVLDLARRLGSAGFLRPTITLAGATAAPGRRRGIPPGRRRSCRDDATGHRRRGVPARRHRGARATVGRAARDAGRLRDRPGMSAGLGLAALGLLAGAIIPGGAGLLTGAVLIGAGTGLATPIAFAHLAGNTAPERLGKPWAPPRSAANSATPADHCSSASSPRP